MSSTTSRPVTLHEQLAIEGAHKAQSDKCRTQLAATFGSKRHLFEEKQVVFTPLAEAALLADIRDVFGPVHLIQWIAPNGRFTRCPLSPEKVARRSEWEDV